ncbi:cilia- and flagella-associated protein 20-like [Schistocerca cancellata]|uniref:cilia- and flagella-associated protein 20-like n=1 Tax=Schistocerca cancellata TaxID=274614 RepID=UPI0021194405|nr:cilia- and flagella-associated protein 20-like [Schistocerca cancellata]
MFRNSKSKLLSIFCCVGAKPLLIWGTQVRNGHIRRVLDEDTKSLVLHIEGRNVATTYITCPEDKSESLAIGLPFLVLVLKNLKKYFSIEITVLDDSNMRRRFRVSNYQSATRVQPFSATMPMSLNPNWNEVRFNLADITRRAYGTAYIETVRVQVHANCRLRRIYFSDRLYANDELPKDYKFFPRVN